MFMFNKHSSLYFPKKQGRGSSMKTAILVLLFSCELSVFSARRCRRTRPPPVQLQQRVWQGGYWVDNSLPSTVGTCCDGAN